MLVQTYPQLSSTSSSSSPSTTQPLHPPPPQHPNGINCSTRIVRLRRIGNSPLGFSIRGGWEHGTGIFISEVHPGSEAQLEGLKPGDQILRVNGFIIEQAIHEEVIALIKSSSRITLKVKSVGMIPIKSNRSETLSWKLVDTSTSTNLSNGNNLIPVKNANNGNKSTNNNNNNNSSNSSAVSSLSSDSNSHSSGNSDNNGGHPNHHHRNHHQLLHRSHHHPHHPGPPPPPPPCPVHSGWSIGSSSKSPSSARSSLSSSRSSEEQSCPDKDIFTSYGMTHGDYMEARVFIRIAPGQGLGCSVVKGPSNYPGIFVQTIKEGGIAQESGLEVGDQIIAMNGLSMEPGDIEFNEAITRIKSASQMTLTVRKKSGLSLFHQQQQQQQQQQQLQQPQQKTNHHHHYPKHRVKAIVHSPPAPTKTNGTTRNGISKAVAAAAVAAVAEEIYHSPIATNHYHSSESSSASSFSGPSRFYTPSEHDYSLSEVESNGNDVMKLPLHGHETSSTCNGKVGLPLDKVLLIDGGRRVMTGDPVVIGSQASAALIYDKVRREEERLAEEKKKLESEQKRLQCELEKLEKERKQLENLKPQDDSKSISSSSTISGSGNPSITSSNGSTSQMGFLDEIKKLAEKRSSENGLITDTLNKTRNLEKIIAKGPKTSLISGQDDENRKRHELLMEEFRAAHSKMFGSGERKLREVIRANGMINGEKTVNNQQINGQQSKQDSPNLSNGHSNGHTNGHTNDHPMDNKTNLHQAHHHHHHNQGSNVVNNNNNNNNMINNNPHLNNNVNNNNNSNSKLIKGLVVTSKSIPPPIQQTITNANGETVTILRTTSPCKKSLPPPIPVKKTTSSPIVTITSYESHHSCKNRFLINNEQSNNSNESDSNHRVTNSTVKSQNLVTVDGKTIGDVNSKNETINGFTTTLINNEIKDPLPTSVSSSSTTATTIGPRPVSIKINLQ